MPKSVDLTGKRFGRLTVIKKSNKKRYGRLNNFLITSLLIFFDILFSKVIKDLFLI